MKWTDEHESIREIAAKFVDNEINPYVDQWEDDGIFPAHELFKKLGDLGMLGINKPEKYGGLGLDYSYSIVFAEEMGRVKAAGVSTGIGVQTDMATPALAKFGSEELCQQYLVPAISGDAVFSIAVSEPSAGSDVASIKTIAKKNGDDYVINGSKMWITNSIQADYFCVLANTSDDPQHKNKSLIIVPSDTKGVSVSEPLKKLGLHSSDTAQIFFDNVKVPQKNRIGDEGKGFIYQMIQFQEERLYAAGKIPGSFFRREGRPMFSDASILSIKEQTEVQAWNHRQAVFEIGEQNLAFAQHSAFMGLRFLDFNHHLSALKDFFRRLDDLGAGALVIFVVHANFLGCVLLHHHLMAVFYQLAHTCRWDANTILVNFDFLRNADEHGFYYSVKRP